MVILCHSAIKFRLILFLFRFICLFVWTVSFAGRKPVFIWQIFFGKREYWSAGEYVITKILWGFFETLFPGHIEKKYSKGLEKGTLCKAKGHKIITSNSYWKRQNMVFWILSLPPFPWIHTVLLMHKSNFALLCIWKWGDHLDFYFKSTRILAHFRYPKRISSRTFDTYITVMSWSSPAALQNFQISS